MHIPIHRTTLRGPTELGASWALHNGTPTVPMRHERKGISYAVCYVVVGFTVGAY